MAAGISPLLLWLPLATSGLPSPPSIQAAVTSRHGASTVRSPEKLIPAAFQPRQTQRRRPVILTSLVAPTLFLNLAREMNRVSLAVPFKTPEKRLPRPLNIPRDRLDVDTAITLMRSSYDVTDALDICPMDDFQTQFYKKRVNYQSEYTSAFYQKDQPNQRAGSVGIGDLSDPQYFDFISFVQYAVINDQIAQNRKVFNEAQGVFGDEGEFETKLIVRDARFLNPETLLKEHSKRVGEIVLDHLLSTSTNRIQIKERPDFDFLVENIRLIHKELESKCFCAAFSIDDSPPSRPDPMKSPKSQPSDIRGDRSISVTLEGPINLWSQQALLAQGYTLRNDFEAKVICEYLRRCNVNSKYQTQFKSVFVTHTYFLEGYTAPLLGPGDGRKEPF